MNSFERNNLVPNIEQNLIPSTGDIVIHRQEVCDQPSHLAEYKTYANLTTLKSVINKNELRNIFQLNDFRVILLRESFDRN